MEVRSEQEDFVVREVADDLYRPWSLAFLPTGEYLITERTGSLVVVDGEMQRDVSGLPSIAVVGQGGLLDVAISPDFTADSTIYFTFAEESEGVFGTAVARGRLLGVSTGSPRLEDVEIIYRAQPKSAGGRHFGSRLVFDNEGYLYVTLGERGSMDRAQDTYDPYGSVLRLNSDGSIPGDNPFADGGSDPGGGAPEIWSYGHRNAQGMDIHPSTGEVWLHEHGPKGGDEINIAGPGENFGWPVVTYGINYDGTTISDRISAPGITDPVLHWTPSIAPSGMAFHTGDVFPGWRGNIFVGALAGQHLRRVEINGDTVVHQEVLLQNRLGRIRDVRTGPDGLIYLLTDSENGVLYRLEPVG